MCKGHFYKEIGIMGTTAKTRGSGDSGICGLHEILCLSIWNSRNCVLSNMTLKYKVHRGFRYCKVCLEANLSLLLFICFFPFPSSLLPDGESNCCHRYTGPRIGHYTGRETTQILWDFFSNFPASIHAHFPGGMGRQVTNHNNHFSCKRG